MCSKILIGRKWKRYYSSPLTMWSRRSPRSSSRISRRSLFRCYTSHRRCVALRCGAVLTPFLRQVRFSIKLVRPIRSKLLRQSSSRTCPSPSQVAPLAFLILCGWQLSSFFPPANVAALIARFEASLRAAVPKHLEKLRAFIVNAADQQRVFKPLKTKITDAVSRLKQILNRSKDGSSLR